MCRLDQAYGAARRPPVKPARHSPSPSLGSCWHASALPRTPTYELRGGGTAIAPCSSRARGAPCPICRHCSRHSARRRSRGRGAAFPSPGDWGCATRVPGCSSPWWLPPSAPLIAPTCRRSSRRSNRGTCRGRLGACVRLPMWPSSSGPACRRGGASAHARSWMARPVGRLSGRVCGGRRPSKACPAPAGSPPWATMTHGWPG